MPAAINTVTADKYSDSTGAIIQNVYQSPGGWCTCNAQVFAQLLHSPEGAQQGSEQWSDEFVLPAGAHYIQRGAIGIRFRSFTAGSPVQVSAALFFRDEPAMVLGGSGISTPSSSVAALNFQKNDVAIATEPTADFIDQASNNTLQLTWSVVDDIANTRVKITPATTWASPTVFPHAISTGPGSSVSTAINGVFIQDAATTGGGIFSVGANSAFTGLQLSVNGDTNGRFVIFQSGTIFWGPGNAGQDCNLYRLQAGVLKCDQTFVAGDLGAFVAGTGNEAIFVAVTGDTNRRFQILGDGSLNWGPGNAVVDTKFYRSSAGQLKFDGSMLGSTNAAALSISANPSIHMYASSNHCAFVSVPAAGFFGYLTARNGDTNWRFQIDSDGIHTWGNGTAAVDLNLYRKSANNIQTDYSFWAGNSVIVDANSGGAGANRLWIGGALDTNMYRQAAGQIVLINQLSVNTTTGNGAGTLTTADRIFSGAASTGGIWVDGGTQQFMGSNSANKLGFFNNGAGLGWCFLVDQLGIGRATGGFLVNGIQTGGGIGYDTGAGGTVTQITSRTTSVTINKLCGQIITATNSLANGANASFTVNNSTVAATDTIVLNMNGSSAIPYFIIQVSAGSFIISYTNNGGLATTTAYTFNFSVVKAVTS